MGADDGVHIGREQVFERAERRGTVKKRRGRHLHPRPQRMQRARHGVMLVAGDDGASARGNERLDGKIQSVGRARGENDLLGQRYVEQLGSKAAAAECRLLRRTRLRIAAASG